VDRAKICLIASDDAEPKVRLPGAKHSAVIATTNVDSDLDDVADEGKGLRYDPLACSTGSGDTTRTAAPSRNYVNATLLAGGRRKPGNAGSHATRKPGFRGLPGP
jgi:hypothetical protein